MRCTLRTTGGAARVALLVAAFTAMLALVAGPPVRAQSAGAGAVHVVERGETLYGIARAHGLTVAELRRLNDGLRGSQIVPGQELRVRPVDAEPSEPEMPADAPAATDATATPFYGAHAVEPGETFYTIAARYGTAVDSVAALNEAVGVFLQPGDTVRLPAALGPPAHAVQAGETIYDVAARYRVSARLLQHVNELDEKAVTEGQYLRIPGREAPAPQPRGTRRPVRERGPVARYPAAYEDRLMAGGARYDPARYVVSHPTLPIGTLVLLTNLASGRQTFAQVADRGPLDDRFVMDVSGAVYEQLGLEAESDQPVAVRVMD